MLKKCSSESFVLYLTFALLYISFLRITDKRCLLYSRYGGVPVDFEIVQIDPTSESNEDLEYAITSIRRNGVAIKGIISSHCLNTKIIMKANERKLFTCGR